MNGILGRKLGMTQIFTEDGIMVPVTVVEAGPMVITQLKTVENDGYQAVQVGYGEVKEKSLNKPQKGHFAKAGVGLKKFGREFRSEDVANYTLAQELNVSMFEVGQKVDVTGTSKGKGFQGVVKRHNFGGVMQATHGQHNRLRAPGSIGAGSDPSRVFKGLRMAGRMGGKQVTVQNLQVLKVDTEQNLLVVKGAVPGAKNSYVIIRRWN